MRGEISALIRQALPGKNGGLASALIVGDRSGIDRETAESLRHSGLAHILAISGLHMALVSATVIFVLRALFALFPTVSLNYSTRKWACALALVVASAYLLLSGASVSTRRAYIMIAIMLLAVLCDRRALTMRNVALAALLVLFMAPESVLSPGFQMSFAAVAALVATYEIVRKMQNERWATGRVRPGDRGAFSRFVVRDMGGLALTSLVAGIATSLFAAYHFQRVAPMGLAANLLAMPLVTFFVMPLALLSVLAMPFALEAVPLAFMGQAMDWVVGIAGWASQAGPAGYTGFVPIGVLIFGSLALLSATLARTRLKFIAVPFVILAAYMLVQRDYPGVVILENANQIGVVDSRDGLRLLKPNADKFSTSMWRSAFDPSHAGQIKPAPRGKAGEGFLCDGFGCSTQYNGMVITHIRNTANFMDDCRLSDVIVVPYVLKNACYGLPENQRPIIIDRAGLMRHGAMALYGSAPSGIKTNSERQPGRVVIRHTYGTYPRPWTRHRFEAR